VTHMAIDVFTLHQTPSHHNGGRERDVSS